MSIQHLVQFSVIVFLSAVYAPDLSAQRNNKTGVEKVPELKSLDQAKPGETALLQSAEGMGYFIRLPKTYDAEKGTRLVIFMHGSNMCGLTYLRSFEAQDWCTDDIMVCPNGEASGDDPYGANNFGFASANPVSAMTKEIQEALNVSRTYIGGHSQGGFVTYSVIMHYPDLYQGAFPMAGDCWMQNEPDLWEDDAEKSVRQKQIPIAIIHGQADPVVNFSQGKHANDCFMATCYPKLRFFAPKDLGHQFMLSPVEEALEWMDAMNGVDPPKSMELAQQWIKENHWGWAYQAALAVEQSLTADEESRTLAKRVMERIEEPAAVAANEIATKIMDDKTGNWITDWFEFHHQFGGTKVAGKMVESYNTRRNDQREPGKEMFYEAYQLIRDEKTKPDAYAKLEQLMVEFPCTYHAFYAKQWLENRTDKPKVEKKKFR